jgi:hypothetical protein
VLGQDEANGVAPRRALNQPDELLPSEAGRVDAVGDGAPQRLTGGQDPRSRSHPPGALGPGGPLRHHRPVQGPAGGADQPRGVRPHRPPDPRPDAPRWRLPRAQTWRQQPPGSLQEPCISPPGAAVDGPLLQACNLRLSELAGDSNPHLLVTRQRATVRGVLACVVLAAQVGWVVRPVRSCGARVAPGGMTASMTVAGLRWWFGGLGLRPNRLSYRSRDRAGSPHAKSAGASVTVDRRMTVT